MHVNFDRIKGALYGVAVGDALGGPLEFMSRATVRMAYPNPLREMVGGGWLKLRPGETTDDTAMSLCVAEGILAAAPASADDDALAQEIGARFVRWLDSNPPDVGATCRAAILRAQANLRTMQPLQAWYRAADSLGQNQDGNGALMRCVYPGLWYTSAQAVQHAAVMQSHMTHSGELSATCCSWYATVIWLYTLGGVEPVLSHCPVPVTPVSADWAPSGYVADTLHAAMLAMKQPDFEATLVAAVNYGGDADTVGAIAGGLAGAKYGYAAIPARWVQALDPALRAQLDALARQACDHRKQQ